MIPSAAAMKAIAIALEEARAKDGWDAEPLLAVVVKVPTPGPEGTEAYGVVPFPVQPSDLSEQPAQSLLYLGGALRVEGGPPALLPPSLRRNVAGVVFAGEGWMAAAEGITSADDERRLADIPGSKEVRFVHLLDCSGRSVSVNRVRGEAARPLVIEPGSADDRLTGNIVVGLRDFLLGLGRHMRPDAMDREAIAALARQDDPTGQP